MKFNIVTLGCKVNAYESEVIKEKMLSSGFYYDIKNADIIILNTCSVTNVADNKSLKMVRKLKRENPNSVLAVCGCSVQNDYKKFESLGVDILIGNKQKSIIDTLIKEYFRTHKLYESICNMQASTFEDMTIDKFNHVRAYIKIQDGCNNYCSYCIIPYLRGNLRCKDYDLALKEANVLVQNGHKEIVLTGIHTGTYQSQGHDLCDLIEDLAKINGLERIRLSSIEITEIDNDKFYNLLKNNHKLCDNLHIPIQAGSNEILKRMNRKYDLDYFKNVINKIRNIRPNIYISTDCLVGHPYETDELFESTLNTIKEIKFSKIHVFPYSKREGTASSRMECQVPEKVKHERARKLIKLSTELENDYDNLFINSNAKILVEEIKNGYAIGHTSNMLKLKIKGDYKINEIITTTIKKDNYE